MGDRGRMSVSHQAFSFFSMIMQIGWNTFSFTPTLLYVYGKKKKKKKNIKVEACFPVSYHVKIQTQSCMYMNTGPNSYVTPFYD